MLNHFLVFLKNFLFVFPLNLRQIRASYVLAKFLVLNSLLLNLLLQQFVFVFLRLSFLKFRRLSHNPTLLLKLFLGVKFSLVR